MPMTHAPETSTRKLASVSGVYVMQSGAEFFWHQILESNRTVFYFVTESGNHMIKIHCNLVITLMVGAKRKGRYNEMSVITK